MAAHGRLRAAAFIQSESWIDESCKSGHSCVAVQHVFQLLFSMCVCWQQIEDDEWATALMPCCYSCAVLRSEMRSVYENTQALHVFPVQICFSETNSGNLKAYLQTCVHTCPHAVNTITRTNDLELCAELRSRFHWTRLMFRISLFPFVLCGSTDRLTHTHLGSFGSSDWRPAPHDVCVEFTRSLLLAGGYQPITTM